MPKLFVWALRLTLLLLTPVFLFCAGMALMMMRLDAWAAEQLGVKPAMPSGKPQLVRRETLGGLTGTEHGAR
jgi:hypothetical protein